MQGQLSEQQGRVFVIGNVGKPQIGDSGDPDLKEKTETREHSTLHLRQTDWKDLMIVAKPALIQACIASTPRRLYH